jgi:hypothetical protein
MGAQLFQNVGGVLVGHQAEVQLGRGAGRDHRLVARALVASGNALDVAGGIENSLAQLKAT